MSLRSGISICLIFTISHSYGATDSCSTKSSTGSCAFSAANDACGYILGDYLNLQHGQFQFHGRPFHYFDNNPNNDAYYITWNSPHSSEPLDVVSPCIPAGTYCLKFWYVLPSSAAHFHLDIGPKTLLNMPTIRQWTELSFNFTENADFRLTFRIDPTTHTSLAALDDIQLFTNKVSPRTPNCDITTVPITTTTPTETTTTTTTRTTTAFRTTIKDSCSTKSSTGSCTFSAANDTCGYTLGDHLNLQHGQFQIHGKPFTYFDNNPNNDAYYITWDTPSSSEPLDVVSPCIPAGTYCLTFWYVLPTYVLFHLDIGPKTLLNMSTIRQWTELSYNITENSDFRLTFRIDPTTHTSLAALDDIQLFTNKASPRFPHCDIATVPTLTTTPTETTTTTTTRTTTTTPTTHTKTTHTKTTATMSTPTSSTHTSSALTSLTHTSSTPTSLTHTSSTATSSTHTSSTRTSSTRTSSTRTSSTPTSSTPTSSTPTSSTPTSSTPTSLTRTSSTPTSSTPTSSTSTSLTPTSSTPTSSTPTSLTHTSSTLTSSTPTSTTPTSLTHTSSTPTSSTPTSITPTSSTPSSISYTSSTPTSITPTSSTPTTLTSTSSTSTTSTYVSITPPSILPTSSTPTSIRPTSITPPSITPPSITPTSLTSTSITPTSITPPLISPPSITPTSSTTTSILPTSSIPTSITPTSITPTSITPTSSTPTSISTTSITSTSSTPTSITPTSSTPSSITPTSITPTLITPTSIKPSSITPLSITPISVTPTSSTTTAITPTSTTPISVTPTSSTTTAITPTSTTPTSLSPTSIYSTSSKSTSSTLTSISSTSSTPTSITPTSSTPTSSTPTSITSAWSMPTPTTPTSITSTSSTLTSPTPTSLTPTSLTLTSITPTLSTLTSLIPTSITSTSSTPTPLTHTSSTPTSITPTSSTPTSISSTSSTPTSITSTSSTLTFITSTSSTPTSSTSTSIKPISTTPTLIRSVSSTPSTSTPAPTTMQTVDTTVITDEITTPTTKATIITSTKSTAKFKTPPAIVATLQILNDTMTTTRLESTTLTEKLTTDCECHCPTVETMCAESLNKASTPNPVLTVCDLPSERLSALDQYSCNFDHGLCGFSLTDYPHLWELTSNRYGDASVGEINGDHSKESFGSYVVFNTYNNHVQNNTLHRFRSPSLLPFTQYCASFWYNMPNNGSDLQVYAEFQNGSQVLIWQQSGSTTYGWVQANIALYEESSCMLVFSATKKNLVSFLGIDDIQLSVEKPLFSILTGRKRRSVKQIYRAATPADVPIGCSCTCPPYNAKNCQTTLKPIPPYEPSCSDLVNAVYVKKGSCDFDHGTTCNYDIPVYPHLWDIIKYSYGNKTAGIIDGDTSRDGNGMFLAFVTDNFHVPLGLTGNFRSGTLPDVGKMCLSFWYNLPTSSASISVYKEAGDNLALLWKKENQTSNGWQKATVIFQADVSMKIDFVSTKSNLNAYFGIDDIQLYSNVTI